MTYGELLETEREQTLAEVADWLRAFADDLEGADELTIASGEHSVTVERPTETIEFELEVEREPENGTDEIEVEIELEWDVPAAEDADVPGEEPEDTEE